MRRPAAQGSADANQSELARLYEELYCSVLDTHELGGGMGDLLIGVAQITDIVEVKTEGGELESSQVTFHRDWRGRKPLIIRNREDVIAHVQRVRAEAAGKS